MKVDSKTLQLFTDNKCAIVMQTPEKHIYLTLAGAMLFFYPDEGRMEIHDIIGQNEDNLPVVAPRPTKQYFNIMDNNQLAERLYSVPRKPLTQEIFSGQPSEVNWAGVDYDSTLHFGRAINPRITWASERWRGFQKIGLSITDTEYTVLTSIYRNKQVPTNTLQRMENMTVDKNQMLSAKAVNEPWVGNSWAMLGSDKWRYDRGLLQHLRDKFGDYKANYIFTEKCHKRLWDLLLYLGRYDAIEVAIYYKFPDAGFFGDFLKFVYNHVRSANDWKCPAKMNQMDLFPYRTLHALWNEDVLQPSLKALKEEEQPAPDGIRDK